MLKLHLERYSFSFGHDCILLGGSGKEEETWNSEGEGGEVGGREG